MCDRDKVLHGISSCGYCDGIVDIYDMKPYKVSEVVCLKCLRRWLAVRPEETQLKALECPYCGRIGFVIETGEILDEQTD